MTLSKVALYFSKGVSPATRIISIVGAVVLAIMMLLTAADVILRYLFSRPIAGSYELTVFMMSLLVAFSLAYTGVQKAHIRIDVVINKLSDRVRAFIDSITYLVSVGILGVITWQSILYAQMLKAGGNTSGTLFIPIYPFVYAVAFGSALLAIVFFINLLEFVSQTTQKTRWHVQLGLILGVIIIAALFSVPIFRESIPHIGSVTAGFIGMGVLIILMFTGMPIAVVMAVLGFLGMVYVNGFMAGVSIMGTTPYSEASSYNMSVIPLFTLMGLLCFHSKLSQELYYAAYKWLGHLPGGLAITTVGACAAFAAVTGSSLAEVATMGMVAVPEMKKYRYNPSLATACIAAAGGIGILIPPSIILVIYGILTEESIGKLFLAGFIPGVLQAVIYMVTIYMICKRNPLMGPPGERSGIMERFTSLKASWGVIALFVLVIGGIYFGVFTPTEAGGVGAFGAFILALGRRQLSWKGFVDSLTETGKITAMVFFILIGATLLSYFLAVTKLPFELSNFVAGLGINRYAAFAVIVVIYLVLGCVMSSIAMVVVTIPIIFPVVVALGFSPIWFGVIIVILVELAMITPPYGINVFILQGIAKDVPSYTIFRGVVPFVIAGICEIILLTAFPQIATILPSLMK